jgi:hypothetical protein
MVLRPSRPQAVLLVEISEEYYRSEGVNHFPKQSTNKPEFTAHTCALVNACLVLCSFSNNTKDMEKIRLDSRSKAFI